MGKTLYLTLSEKPFEVMVTGEKGLEFRQDTQWLRSRLLKEFKKVKYDYVHFTHGYGKHRPYFKCIFLGFGLMPVEKITYSNGLTILPDIYIVLILGEIIEKGNLK